MYKEYAYTSSELDHTSKYIHLKLIEVLNEYKNCKILSIKVIEHLYSPQNFVQMTKAILQSGLEWEGGHIKFWSYNSLKSFLSTENFSEFKFIGCGRSPYLWKSMLIICKHNAH